MSIFIYFCIILAEALGLTYYTKITGSVRFTYNISTQNYKYCSRIGKYTFCVHCVCVCGCPSSRNLHQKRKYSKIGPRKINYDTTNVPLETIFCKYISMLTQVW